MKCYCCESNDAVISEDYQHITYEYCYDCYYDILKAKNILKNITNMDCLYQIVNRAERDIFRYYNAVFKALLKRQNYEADIKDLLKSVEEV